MAAAAGRPPASYEGRLAFSSTLLLQYALVSYQMTIKFFRANTARREKEKKQASLSFVAEALARRARLTTTTRK